MWYQVIRIIFWLCFLWLAVLHFRYTALTWIIIPLFELACLLIAQYYIEIRPRFGSQEYSEHRVKMGRRLNAVLVTLLLAHNVVFTIWPLFVLQLPATAAALVGLKTRADTVVALHLPDPGVIKAQEAVAKYGAQVSDAEATAIDEGFKRLIAKRRAGTFNADDQAEEQRLLVRFQVLAQRSADLRRIVAELPNSPTRSPNRSYPDPIPSPPAQPTRTAERPSTANPRSSNIESSPTPPAQPERSRAQELDALINSLVPSSDPRIAAIFKSENRQHGSIEPVLYQSLNRQDSRVISDLFQEPRFTSKGFFAEIDSGNTETLVQTRAVRMVSHFLAGRVSDECSKGTSIDQDLVRCKVMITAKLFDRSGNLLGSRNAVGTAAAYSESTALKDAVELGAGTLWKELIGLIR